ncbi:MAG: hypothetical protein CM1200mP9_11880 [Gammaproteobacteria bacterium]|nr:MAG: hypothetical protein CM1200mP9_11880 [Gammaproteobacteria bacterium]
MGQLFFELFIYGLCCFDLTVCGFLDGRTDPKSLLARGDSLANAFNDSSRLALALLT